MPLCLPILVIGKDRFDILPAIEHSHDFGAVILQAIEDNLRSAASERKPDRISFLARPAKGKSSIRVTAFLISRNILSAAPVPAAPA